MKNIDTEIKSCMNCKHCYINMNPAPFRTAGVMMQTMCKLTKKTAMFCNEWEKKMQETITSDRVELKNER